MSIAFAEIGRSRHHASRRVWKTTSRWSASTWSAVSALGPVSLLLTWFMWAGGCAPRSDGGPWTTTQKEIDARIESTDRAAPSPRMASQGGAGVPVWVAWRRLPSGRVALVPVLDVADDDARHPASGGAGDGARTSAWVDALVDFNGAVRSLEGFEHGAAMDRSGPPMAVAPSGRSVALRLVRADGMTEVVLFDDWRDPSTLQRTGVSVPRDRTPESPHFLTDIHLRIPLRDGEAVLSQRRSDGIWQPVDLGETPLRMIRVASNRRVAKLLDDGRVAFGILDEEAPDLDAALAAGGMMPPCAPVTDLTLAQHGSIIVLAHGAGSDAATASMESYRFPEGAPNRPMPVDFVAGRPVSFDDAYASFEPASGEADVAAGGAATSPPALRAATSIDGRPMILVVAADGGLELAAPTFDVTFGGPIGTPGPEWTISAFSPDGTTAILQRGAKFSRGTATSTTPIPRSSDDHFTKVIMRPAGSPWTVWRLAAP